MVAIILPIEDERLFIEVTIDDDKLPILPVNDEDRLVIDDTIDEDKLPILVDTEDDKLVTVDDTDDDIAVMFSPPLVREPVTKRLWTFICK